MIRNYIYLYLLFALFSCSKESEAPRSTERVFQLNVEPNFFLGKKSWIVFSNLNGEIIDFGDIPDSGQYTYQIEIDKKNKFHATIITYYEPSIIDDTWSPRKYIDLKTYAFLDGATITLNLKSRESHIRDLLNSAKTVDISLGVEKSDIKESVISGTLTGAKNSNNYRVVKVKEGQETVFTYVHLKGEDNWRMKFLQDIENNTSILINLDEMEEVPTRFVQVPAFYEVEFAVTGIINCEENYSHFLQWFSPAENGKIASRYLPEDNDLFSYYRTDITLINENETYQNISLGAPVDEYIPTAIDYVVEQNNLDNFQLRTSASPFTLYEINYSKINSIPNASNSSNWVIYGDFEEVFISPNLREVLPQNISWFNKDSLDLNTVKEYYFSGQLDYSEWLNLEFDPEFTDGVCNRDRLDIGEQVTIRSLSFD